MRDAVASLNQLGARNSDEVKSELLRELRNKEAKKLIVRMAQMLGSPDSATAERPTRTRQKRQPYGPPGLPEPLMAQATAARESLAKKGAVIAAGELILLLDCTRQALSKAVRANRLFTVDVGSERLYPAFYADPALDRRMLERVAKELGNLPGWSKWQFFTTPKASLGGMTPLAALKQGKFTEARRAAIGFSDR